MPLIQLSGKANEDLFEIWYYIAIENNSRTSADKFVEKLNDQFELIAKKPHIGSSRENLSYELRMWSVGNYGIYYIPSTSGINIIRVLEGHRDIENLFQ